MLPVTSKPLISVRLSKHYQEALPTTLFFKAEGFVANLKALLVSGENRGSQELLEALHKFDTLLKLGLSHIPFAERRVSVRAYSRFSESESQREHE